MCLRELLELESSSASAEPHYQICSGTARVGALWSHPGCFRTPLFTADLPISLASRASKRGTRQHPQCPGLVARPKGSSQGHSSDPSCARSAVTMSVYAGREATVGALARERPEVLSERDTHVGLCWRVFCSASSADVQVALLRAFGYQVERTHFSTWPVSRPAGRPQ